MFQMAAAATSTEEICAAPAVHFDSVVVGLFLAVVGIIVAVAPSAVARAANAVRFVPYATDAEHLHAYRAIGVVLIVAGVVAAIAL
jgi:hypothetical protein